MLLFSLFRWYIDQIFRSRSHDWWRNGTTNCGKIPCLNYIHRLWNMRPWLQLLELKACAAKQHLDHTNWRKCKPKWVTGAFFTSTSPLMCCCRVSNTPKFSSSVSPSILYFLAPGKKWQINFLLRNFPSQWCKLCSSWASETQYL